MEVKERKRKRGREEGKIDEKLDGGRDRQIGEPVALKATGINEIPTMCTDIQWQSSKH